MSNWDWDRFGDDIRRTVQDAVDSQNYERLNQTIADTVRMATDNFAKGMKGVGDVMGKTAHTMNDAAQNMYGTAKDAYGNTWNTRNKNQSGYGNNGRNMGSAHNPVYGGNMGNPGARAMQSTSQSFQSPALYAKPTVQRAGGIILSILGYLSTGVFLTLFGIVFLVALVSSDWGGKVSLALAALGIMSCVAAVPTCIGSSLLARVNRFRSYVGVLAGRGFCDIKELESRVKKSHKFVVKDLERMIAKGWFRQGHLDQQNTCLMVSNEAFGQYTHLMQQMEQKKAEERAAEVNRQQKEKEMREKPGLSPELQEVLDTGDEYIKKIHKCNDAIPGVEISAKISRMEMIIDRIFGRVEQNPDAVHDIRRMMEYYLPTTVKLLEAYEELDRQPVQGDNIISSKVEIEKTLDTLNAAFEKLLDSLFQDTAWDVSSDISVLNMMLAQEGLTEDDFKHK